MKALGLVLIVGGGALLICGLMEINLTSQFAFSSRLVEGLGIAIALGGLLIYKG